MGYWADQLFRSQRPRENGCPVSLIPPLMVVMLTGWIIYEGVT